MKKVLIASLLAATFGVAQAADVTVSAGRAFMDATDLNYGAVALALPVHLPLVGEVAAGVEFAQARAHGDRAYNTFTASATKNVLKLGPVDLGVKVSAGVLDPNGADWGAQMGLGAVAALPVTKEFAVVGAVEQRWGQDRVSPANGTLLSVGLRAKF